MTRSSPLAGYELVESHALDLLANLLNFRERLGHWLVQRLEEQGISGVSPAQLGFLGALDCGTNHAAHIARDLNISRQAVHKTVRELEKRGWLRMSADPNFGNRKTIHFTVEGEKMMALTRTLLRQLDDQLEAEFGAEVWRMSQNLGAWQPVTNPEKNSD